MTAVHAPAEGSAARSAVWARLAAMSEWTVWWLAFVAVSLPLIVGIVALAGRDWFPVLDLAMTELRVRDVGGAHTPLIGLPGRIGPLEDLRQQGSHPGPLSFYLLAPVYRLLGSTSYALLVAMFVLCLLAIGLALWLAHRRGGKPMIVVVAVVLIVLVRGYGAEVLLQPWNPYLPLLFWVVVLLAGWSVLAGDRMMLAVLVGAASLCAQTHVPYLGLGIGLVVACVASTIVDWRRHSLLRNDVLRSWQWAFSTLAVLWVPVLIDQLARDPGNVAVLRRHFSNPTEPVVGLAEGAQLVLRHLDVFRIASELLDGDGAFVRAGFDLTGSTLPGLLFLLVWIGAAGVAVVLRHRRLLGLHAVLAAALVLGWISMSRIFGKVWYYLTLWAWATTVLMVVATVWSYAALLTRDEQSTRTRSVWSAVGTVVAALGLVTLAAGVVEATGTRPPEEHLSEPLGAIVGPTESAIRLGVGPADGPRRTYLVTFEDAANFGSQSYGLVSELERRGLDVGMVDHWRVPITEHRVVSPAEATAEIHLTTGVFVGRWRAQGATEVAYWEPEPEATAEFDELEGELRAGLAAAGLDDLVPLVDTNLFSIQIDERVEPALQATVNRMLHLGQPTAVFLIPVAAEA